MRLVAAFGLSKVCGVDFTLYLGIVKYGLRGGQNQGDRIAI